jgi:BON domain
MRIRTLVLAGGATAAAAYLLDPREGASRRHRLLTIGSSRKERERRIDETPPVETWFAPRVTAIEDPSGFAEAFAPTTPAARVSTPPPISSEAGEDARTVERVKTKLQSRPDLGTEGLVVDVVNGVAYLSGDLRDGHTFGEIVDLTRHVPGVRRVQSLFHLPDSETIGRTITSRRVGEDRDRR